MHAHIISSHSNYMWRDVIYTTTMMMTSQQLAMNDDQQVGDSQRARSK